MTSPGDRLRVFRLGVGPRHVERDVDQELAFHIDMRVRTLVASGVEPAEARRRALAQFGDLGSVRDQCLDIDYQKERVMSRINHLSDLRQDVLFAIRAMRNNLGFTVVVLLTLALGIGASTSTFTLIDALILRTLPVSHPEQLVTIGNAARTGGLSQGAPRNDMISVPVYADVRDQNKTLSGIYASGRTSRLDVLAEEHQTEPEHPHGRFVSASFFTVLGVRAAAGRTFTADEERVPGGAPVVVISWAYWQKRFGGTSNTLGRSLVVNGVPLTIVGIAQKTFTGDIVGQPTDIWLPLMEQELLSPNMPVLTDRGISWLIMMGRRAPGVTVAQARAELTAIENRSLIDHAKSQEFAALQKSLRDDPLMVEPGAQGFSYYRKAFARPLFILMGAVGVVLLIVCANLANLMLSRAAARGREMSVRMTLGANRRRLVQQLFTESVIFALAGGAIGIVFAKWGSSALLALTGGIQLDAHLNLRVLGFTALLSLATAVLFGLVPALRATRVELAQALRAQGRSVAGAERGPGGIGLGKILVVAQVAMSVLLLVGTGMLVHSMRKLQTSDIGIARDNLVLVEIDAQRAGYKDARLVALAHELIDRVSQIQGVTAVSLSENGIFSGTESATTVQVEGFTARSDADTNLAYDDVGPNYFHAIGAHIMQGRDFEARDNQTGQKVAALNQTAARLYFPKGGAIGSHITEDSSTFEIVGLVHDVEEQNLRADPTPRLYMPALQVRTFPGRFNLEIRTAGEPSRLVDPVRRAIVAVNPTLVLNASALPDLISESIAQDRLVASVVSAFGLLALALAALGLYGVMGYATLRRTSEFGLRMALGAEPGQVARMVLGEAMLLVAGGVIVGIPAALAAMRVSQHQLYDVALLDVPSIFSALVVLSGTAALAGYLPARRAARVGPLVALRDS